MVDAYSYEDLYELLRIERASADLEKLELKDLEKIAAYLKAKEELLKKQEISTTFFSTKGRVKIQLEIDNALQLLKDLFEKREGKVVNRAMFSIRADSKLKDTTNMLEHEEELYNALLELLQKNKESFFTIIETQKALAQSTIPSELEIKSAAELVPKPEIRQEESKTELTSNGSEKLEPATEIKKPEPEITSDPTPEIAEAPSKLTHETKLMEFLADTPEFVDETLTPCGPFKQGDQAKLSYTICNILLKQGKAKEVN